ncbi:MAG: HupE/UreJ family protein [Burkholderiales bacterium]
MPGMHAARRLALGVAALLGAVPLAHAHQTQLSSSRLALEGSGATAILELNALDLRVATGASLTDEGGDAILRYVNARVRLGFVDGADCPRAAGPPRALRDHIVIELRFDCPPTGREREYRVTLFHEVDPAARHVVTLDAPQRGFALLGVGNPRLRLSPAEGSLAQTLGHYLLAGIEHIAIGYDHVAFLLAVIAPGGRFWMLFAAVTAFTVAHSITLSLAVLGIVAPPAGIVETLIAASIVYAAAENFFVRDLRRRWILTFGFGLVHGFGFAAALREYGVPGHALVPSLAAFNVGVEIGQLLIVAAAALLWRTAVALRGGADTAPQRRLTLGVSTVVLALGLYWLLERLFPGIN